MITVVPVPSETAAPLRVVLVAADPDQEAVFRSWTDEFGADAEVVVARSRALVAPRDCPTVWVAGAGGVRESFDAEADGLVDHLVVIAADPPEGGRTGTRVTLFVDARADNDDLVARWRTACPAGLAVKTVTAPPLAADSPVPPLLAARLRLGAEFSAERALRHYDDGRAGFPVERTDPSAPPAGYAAPGGTFPRLVRLAYGGRAWLVTGYHDARAILADTTFSSDATAPDYPNFPLASKRPVPGHFLSMDAPDHGRLRRSVAADFSAASLRALRPRLDEHADALVDAMARAGSPADVVDAVAVPLPALVAAELLGVPAEDRPVFQVVARDLQTHDASPARRSVAAGRMNRYLADLMAAKRARAGTDVFSRLARTPEQDRSHTGDELVGMANLILVAGLETTAGLVGLTVLSLLRDPAQGDLVRADPGRWAEPAVREALRYWTVVHHGVARVSTRDVEVSGRRIRPGDAVVVHLPTANRDPGVFERPADFDLTRRAPAHLAFGHGPHRCLGAVLAQFQATSAIRALFERLPDLRLAEGRGEPEFLHDMLVYGVRALAVEW